MTAVHPSNEMQGTTRGHPEIQLPTLQVRDTYFQAHMLEEAWQNHRSIIPPAMRSEAVSNLAVFSSPFFPRPVVPAVLLLDKEGVRRIIILVMPET